MSAPDSFSFRLLHHHLPVFQADRDGLASFYAPGFLAVARPDAAGELAVEFGRNQPNFQPETTAGCLWMAARDASIQGEEKQKRRFQPVCLTLYPRERCNLNCGYCFAGGNHPAGGHLSFPAAAAGARQVAENCRTSGLPLIIAFHGGGEPVLEQDFINKVLDLVEQFELPLFRYIATNGVIPESLSKSALAGQK
jgi:hypothetical protein